MINFNFNAESDTSSTMLQYCCSYGYHDLVDILLTNGADPDAAGMGCPPIVLAGSFGYYKVIEVFLKKSLEEDALFTVDLTNTNEKSENVLHKIFKAESNASVNKHLVDYQKCLNLFLYTENELLRTSIAVASNTQDHRGNTPLHLAGDENNCEAIRMLIRCGARFNIKNKMDSNPYIPPDVMREFLDTCIRIEGKPTGDNFKLTFDYSFLSPEFTIQKVPRKVKAQTVEVLVNEDIEEREELFYSKGGFVEGEKLLSEVDIIKDMAENIQFKHLMAHPTITSFLWMKGGKMLPYYYSNAAFFLIFYSILTSWILKMIEDIDNNNNEESAATAVLKWTTFSFLVVFTFKEIIQIMVSSKENIYMVQFENILETILIILTFCLMFDPLETRPQVAQILTLSEDSVVRIMSASILLMSWILMFCILGNHPQMSELSTLVAMFVRVSFNFFKFLLVFMFFIIAYGFCFYIQYRNPKGEKMPGAEKPHNEYFSSPSKALLKTIVMSLSGEMEFANIEFGNWFGWTMFICFIFFISLVLSNLLNGLAISDIVQLKDEAEVMANVHRLKRVRSIEAVIHHKKLPNLFKKILYSPYLMGSYLYETVFGDTLFLFSQRLPNREAVFYPNKSRKEQSGKGKLDISLPASMLEEAKKLALNKKQISDTELMKQGRHDQ